MAPQVERWTGIAALFMAALVVFYVPSMRIRANYPVFSTDATITGTDVYDAHISVGVQLAMAQAAAETNVPGPQVGFAAWTLACLAVAAVLAFDRRWTAVFVTGVVTVVVMTVNAVTGPSEAADRANEVLPSGSEVRALEGAAEHDAGFFVAGGVHPFGYWVVLAGLLVPIGFSAWRVLVGEHGRAPTPE
ncbi:hypothetical protein [Nocardiopsis suaedae]|uniref:Uncharacterized protein n=1 Tax=Nocardiopsis suaedae TaxID=3018444 RepID=A0ABT4TQ44_9ACTN|nr:hypothetical protein [Nocardiopsis suaedae]MDA2806797.1 hypothetical protein [Nocardiopsis suaedae]